MAMSLKANESPGVTSTGHGGSEVEFPNLWSRIFLRPLFERQFIVPEDPPWLLAAFLRTLERFCMRIELVDQRVDRPIFLIGLPRSGTTMLQDILCAHPEVAYFTNTMNQFRSCFCTTEYFRRLLRLNARGERFVGDSVIVDAGSPNEGFGFWGEWFNWDGNSVDYVDLRIEDLTPAEIEKIHHIICKVVWTRGGEAKRFFNKNPNLLPALGLLNEVFPGAKFIHIVRDPRMCANSMIKLYHKNVQQIHKLESLGRSQHFDSEVFVPYPRLPGLAQYLDEFGAADVRTTANLWSEAASFVDNCKDSLGSFYEVRYEDILANPSGEITKVMAFCELSDVSRDTEVFWQKLGDVGVVRHTNQYSDYDVIESICAEGMAQRGYALDGSQ